MSTKTEYKPGTFIHWMKGDKTYVFYGIVTKSNRRYFTVVYFDNLKEEYNKERSYPIKVIS